MAKNSAGNSKVIKSLTNENLMLRLKLGETRETVDAIKTGNIDALVIADKKDLKVYTDSSADNTYRILIEKMNEGAVTLDEDGTILYCNFSFAKMVNVPLQNIAGTKFDRFIEDASKAWFETLLQQGKVNDEKQEIYLFAGNGKYIPVLMSVNMLTLGNKVVLSIILTDLTTQIKNKEEIEHNTQQLEKKNIELENVNKDLTAFTYLSSHDLQEPLRKIQTFVTLLYTEEYKNLSKKGKDYFRRMQLTARRMQALIEDLLTYSRTNATGNKLEKTNLSAIVTNVKKDLEEVIQQKNARIEAADLGAIWIIPFQFRQLLHNLISNSLKFSYPEKKIQITIKSKIVKGSKLTVKNLQGKTDYCHITYTDNGIGFDPQYNERIFEVFQRLHSKEDYPGTGMGLAICKRIVENHNGLITATGKLNKGARFDIYIPAA